MGTRIYPKRMPRFYLKEWRERPDHFLTQEQLGERLDVAGVTVGRWETSHVTKKHRPDYPTLAAIAEALPGNVRFEDLFRHPDRPSADDLLRGQPEDVIDNAMKMIAAIRKSRP